MKLELLVSEFYPDDFDNTEECESDIIPERMLLNIHHDPVFVFGLKRKYGADKYVGMQQDEGRNRYSI